MKKIGLLIFILLLCSIAYCFADKVPCVNAAGGDQGNLQSTCLLAAQKGDPEAQYLMGGIYDNSDNLQEALKWYLKSAKQGFSQAFYPTGSIFKELDDHKNACYWFTKAANKGNALGMGELGNCFYFGAVGYKKDVKTALKWYTKGANANDALSKAMLSVYLFGSVKNSGVKKNEYKALVLLKQSADQCFEPAIKQYEEIIGHEYENLPSECRK